MGAIRTNATALLSAGATGAVLALGVLGAPSATAAEAQPITSFGFAITPSTVAPGGRTVLSVTGCNAAYATVSSGVFDTVSIARGQTARVTVDRDARRGAVYSVSFTCNGETGSADLTITGGTTRPTTSSTSTATARSNTSVTSTSTGGASLGVRGGLGGSVAGMDTRELGAGAGLFLAAAGGTAYALRRRSARGH
ncbi:MULTISPECIES: hypothetical protein [unclassified Streptomyces]|uniref:Lipoprotein n=1 Tax=Streptomyces sp. R33 TaxID=3238629 RepID=A0AB39XZF7_9ACTN|nr:MULTISPECIES: hypothetical protein [unclassified Streptomyces]KJY47761.1 hypothetical protein VR46_01715 [Streptomyces sp. NRRL S-444]TDU74810.1 hypothetical protein EDD91_1469 [Streptomyces sp. KS 21]THA37498.1 hypothetical protein E6W17_20130 [Streptomyces sp. A1547]